MFAINIEKLKYHMFKISYTVLVLMNTKKYLKKKNQLKY